MLDLSVLKPISSSHTSGFLFVNSILVVVFFGLGFNYAVDFVLGLVNGIAFEKAVVFFGLFGICLFGFYEQKKNS